MEVNQKTTIMIIGSVFLVAVVAILVVKSLEHFTNTEQGGPFTLQGLPLHYGAVSSNPDSVPTKTSAEYEQLSAIRSTQLPYNTVLPGMMHLPPLRDIYNRPVRDHKVDFVSGVPEWMYTSPRVPLTDFQSETTRDYQVYQ